MEKGCILSYYTAHILDTKYTSPPQTPSQAFFSSGLGADPPWMYPSKDPFISAICLCLSSSINLFHQRHVSLRITGRIEEGMDLLLKFLCVFSPVFLFFLVHFLSLCPLLVEVSHWLIWSCLSRLCHQYLSRRGRGRGHTAETLPNIPPRNPPPPEDLFGFLRSHSSIAALFDSSSFLAYSIGISFPS